MVDKSKPGHELSGKISDRIRSGEIAAGRAVRDTTQEETPTAESVRNAEGHGMGSGASRNGGE